MKEKINLTLITRGATRCIALILAILIFTMPRILDWYATVRTFTERECSAVTVAFYICAVFVGFALWQMDRLLGKLLCKQVFLRENVRRVRCVQWCCAGVSLVCLPAAAFYYPLIFMFVVMGFLSLVICVVCRVLDEAVSLREENDLTI